MKIPMVSILVNSHIPEMAQATRAMYSRLLAGRAHEVIVISDARSMCEGYSRGMKAVHGDVVVFAHHDLEYLFDDFAAVLDRAMAQFDLIGVAGTDELIHPVWMAAGVGRIFGQVVHPKADGGFLVSVYGAPAPAVGGIQAMDGLFLAARREVVQVIGWDTGTFDGWHFYDIDFSYRAAQAGYRLGVIPELGFLHNSVGTTAPEYDMYARRFVAKHSGTIRWQKARQAQWALQTVPTLDQARLAVRPPFWRR